MESGDNFTKEEFERLTNRMRAFKANPGSLRPDVYKKCLELHNEISNDAKVIERIIADSGNIEELSDFNSRRAELVEWLAREP